MSKGVNKVTLLGNAGKDPVVKYLPSGSAVAEFSLAINYRTKKNDAWEDAVEWVSCKAFAKTAEVVEKYVTKGKQLYVEGRIQTSSWEKDGEKKYRTDVIVSELVLLGGKDGNRDEYDQRNKQSETVEDQDIPF